MATIKQTKDAFELLYRCMRESWFSKTLDFPRWNEKLILPNIRFFLLGYFGDDLEPEFKTELLTANSGNGYIDFVVGNTAIEFAVRLPGESASKLNSYSNRTERVKLIRRKKQHNWLSNGALVLFDFSDTPLTNDQLEEYREKPSLNGSGNHNIDGFSVLYFHFSLDTEDTDSCCIRKNIDF